MKIPALADKSFSRQLNFSLGELTNQLEFSSREWISGWLTPPALAGDRLVVAHGLKAVPTGYRVVASRGDVVGAYHVEQDEDFWSSTEIVVRLNATGYKFRLAVVRQD